MPIVFQCSPEGTLACHLVLSKKMPCFVSCVALLKDLEKWSAMVPEPWKFSPLFGNRITQLPKPENWKKEPALQAEGRIFKEM